MQINPRAIGNVVGGLAAKSTAVKSATSKSPTRNDLVVLHNLVKTQPSSFWNRSHDSVPLDARPREYQLGGEPNAMVWVFDPNKPRKEMGLVFSPDGQKYSAKLRPSDAALIVTEQAWGSQFSVPVECLGDSSIKSLSLPGLLAAYLRTKKVPFFTKPAVGERAAGGFVFESVYNDPKEDPKYGGKPPVSGYQLTPDGEHLLIGLNHPHKRYDGFFAPVTRTDFVAWVQQLKGSRQERDLLDLDVSRGFKQHGPTHFSGDYDFGSKDLNVIMARLALQAGTAQDGPAPYPKPNDPRALTVVPASQPNDAFELNRVATPMKATHRATKPKPEADSMLIT